MSDQPLKPLGLRCQWTQPGGYPQCRLLLAHEGEHEYIELDEYIQAEEARAVGNTIDALSRAHITGSGTGQPRGISNGPRC